MLDAIMLKTFETIEDVMTNGCSRSWHVNRVNAANRKFAVLTRNANGGGEPSVPDRSAFLVGEISSVTDTADPEYPGRHQIEFGRVARVDVPEAWKPQQNPLAYVTLESLGIDPEELDFQPVEAVPTSADATQDRERGLSISEAIRLLALGLGVPEASIQITITG